MQLTLVGNVRADEMTPDVAETAVGLINDAGKLLFCYARDKKNHRIGVIIVYKRKDNDEIYIGVSKCNFKSGDKFDRNKGIVAAFDNSIPLAKIIPTTCMSRKNYAKFVEDTIRAEGKKVPDSVIDDYIKMFYRAKRYFDIA